jgi:two-component system sporulation sensor kinase B
MDLLMKDLLINFLIILFFLFFVQLLYQLKYAYRLEESKEWIFSIFPVLSLILCMAFPVAVNEDFSWDLRRIPFILGALYGGYKLGFLLLFLMLIIRFFMGGDGFYLTFLSFLPLTVMLFFVSSYYLKMSVKHKVMVSCLLTCLSVLITIFLSEQFFNTGLATIMWVEYFVINVIGILITTFLWEVMRTNFDVLQKLIKAEKLEVVSHLAASISHEVRNPLTVSRGFMQLSSDEELSPQKRKQYVDTAIKELDRAAEIINDYLTFAKPALEKKEKINVFEEVRQAVQVITPLSNMNAVQIRLDSVNNETAFVFGDRKKFDQCLINFLKNGIESMPNGGELRIHIDDDHPYLHVSIRDEGKGMTREQINRLGEPYFTTKETGTGLGMMVSFSIINGMGGKIDVVSEPGKGTCFSIQLPSIKSQQL